MLLNDLIAFGFISNMNIVELKKWLSTSMSITIFLKYTLFFFQELDNFIL